MAAGALACAALAGGCGTPSADLMVIERTGDVPGGRLTLRLQDGGEATCNGKRAGTAITSKQLIVARTILRELKGKPDEDEPGLLVTKPRLPAAPGSVFAFRVRTEDGTVTFADNSPGSPPTYGRLIKLTRDVAREACGLAR